MWTSQHKKKDINNKENRETSLKTVFLQLQDNFIRPTFPKSIPQKKHKEHHKLSLRNVPQQGEGIAHQKVNTGRSNSLQIDHQGLKLGNIKFRSQSQKKQDFPLQEVDQAINSKMKFNTSRNWHQPRSKTVHTQLPLEPSKKLAPEKKLANILFHPSVNCQTPISSELLNSSNVYLRSTSGHKHKINGYMYLHKLKIKFLNIQRRMSMVQGQSYPRKPVQRQLMKKKDRNAANKQYYLSTYTNFQRKKMNKIVKTQYYEKKFIDSKDEECRPWSGRESLKSDHHID